MKKETYNPIDKAISLFNQGFTCSQAVFAALAPLLGMDEKTALKAACGLGGGMGRQALTCGAVTGAYMALGLKYGSCSPDDSEAKEHTYQRVREFAAKFIALHNTTQCRDLLGYDLGNPDDAIILREEKICATICPGLVRDAATILQDMLNNK